MISRPLVCLGLTVLLLGCATEEQKKKKETAAKEKARKEAQKPINTPASDPAFASFIGRLRVAAAQKDTTTLGSMMTPDFGYRWDTPPVGDNVFTYWDLNNTWPALRQVLRENFVPHEGYMVAPSAVANDPAYRGFRAGIRQINGAWRFAYFVPDESLVGQ